MLKITIDTKELEENISRLIQDKVPQIIQDALIHHLYKDEIKGFEDTSRMLGISESTLRNYINQNMLQKGVHYDKKGSSSQSQVIFYKNKLLSLFSKYKNIVKSKC